MGTQDDGLPGLDDIPGARSATTAPPALSDPSDPGSAGAPPADGARRAVAPWVVLGVVGGLVLLLLVCFGIGAALVHRSAPDAAGGGAVDGGSTGASVVPATQHLAAGLLVTADSFTSYQATDPVTLAASTSDLVTPAGTLQLTSSATVQSVVTSSGDTAVAASGERLHAVAFTWTPGAAQADIDTQGKPDASALPAVVFAVQSGSGSTALADLAGSSQGQRYIVSAPSGEDPMLVASVGGVDQRIDLVTGEREANTQTAAYYLPQREQAVAVSGPRTTHSAPSSCGNAFGCDWRFTFQMTVTNVALSPYDYASQSWAPAGQVFLEMQQDDRSHVVRSGQLTYLVDESAWTATVDGTTVRQADVTSTQVQDPGPVYLETYRSGGGRFLVPAGTTAVHLDLPTTIRTTPQAQFDGRPPGSFTGGTVRFDVTFP